MRNSRLMKTIIKNILLFLLAGILFNSCSKDNFTEFDINYPCEFTIQTTTGVNTPLSLPTFDITTYSSAEFKKNNTTADLVKEIILTRAKLTLHTPPGKTFSFLKSIHIFISSPGYPEVDIAYSDNVPVSTELTLTTTGVLLDKYIKSEKFKVAIKIVTDETVLEEMKIKAELGVHVKADLL